MIGKDLLVISNNSLVKELNDIETDFFPGNVLGVISRALFMAAEGHRLFSHPLAGSIKPNQNPYKSILMSRKKLPVDMVSLERLHKCLEKTEAMIQDQPLLSVKAAMSEDYQMMDFCLLQTAIESL